jgi:putative membrane protein
MSTPRHAQEPENSQPSLHESLAQRRAAVAADLKKLADETNDRAGNAWQRFIRQPWTNPWRIFARDVRSICTNVVGLIMAIGLIIIPSFYAWFNIAGAWNIYDNTGGLKVAVANQDKGYQSDLLPMRVNVGSQLVDQLRANKQLGWTFVSRADAIEGVHSGVYYAAIVIPKSFSSDMMTFFSPTVRKAKIVYYENQKENPIAPKVTGQGASTISAEVNSTFTSTVTSVALDVATTLGKFMDSPRTRTAMSSFIQNMNDLASTTRSSANLVGSYSSIISTAGDVVSSAGAALPASSSLTSQASRATSGARRDASKAKTSLDSVAAALSSAANQSESATRNISGQVDKLFDDASSSVSTSASRLDAFAAQTHDLATSNRTLQSSVDDSATQIGSLLAAFDQRHPTIPSGPAGAALRATRAALVSAQTALTTFSGDLGRAATSLDQAGTQLSDTAASARNGIAGTAQTRKSVTGKLSSAASQLHSLATESSDTLNSSLKAVSGSLDPVLSGAVDVARDADRTIGGLSSSTDKAAKGLKDAGSRLSKTQKRLGDASQSLSDFSARLSDAVNSGDAKKISEVTRSNGSKIASLIAAPISVDRHAVFPVATFGMQMTPFYGILAVWVGSTLLAVAVTPELSERKRRGLRKLTQHQIYWGRQLAFSTIALLQGTFMGLGLLFFLHVQAVHPWLFMVTMWGTALTFSIIMYSLDYSMGAIGKAICLILLVVQISGSNGMYPVVLMPRFFSAVMPFLPASHAMNALRACIGGFYGMEWYADMGKLLVFIVPMLIISLALKKPLSLLADAFGRATHASHLLP